MSKRTSSNKLFDYDCATLYVEPNNISSFPGGDETDLKLKAWWSNPNLIYSVHRIIFRLTNYSLINFTVVRAVSL